MISEGLHGQSLWAVLGGFANQWCNDLTVVSYVLACKEGIWGKVELRVILERAIACFNDDNSLLTLLDVHEWRRTSWTKPLIGTRLVCKPAVQ
jgi:hypothetical protein